MIILNQITCICETYWGECFLPGEAEWVFFSVHGSSLRVLPSSERYGLNFAFCLSTVTFGFGHHRSQGLVPLRAWPLAWVVEGCVKVETHSMLAQWVSKCGLIAWLSFLSRSMCLSHSYREAVMLLTSAPLLVVYVAIPYSVAQQCWLQMHPSCTCTNLVPFLVTFKKNNKSSWKIKMLRMVTGCWKSTKQLFFFLLMCSVRAVESFSCMKERVVLTEMLWRNSRLLDSCFIYFSRYCLCILEL